MRGSYGPIRVEREGDVALVTLDRPAQRNAMDKPMRDGLTALWTDLAEAEEVETVVLTGAGVAFCAGGDIAAMAARIDTAAGLEHSFRMPSAQLRLLRRMLDVEQPIVVAAQGDAVGLGATIALFADIVVIAETARFGDAHVNIGLAAGDGSAVVWPLILGPLLAKEFLMTGRLITGREAVALRLANHAVPAAAVLPHALDIARRLAAGPRWATRWTKAAVNKQLRRQLDEILDGAAAFEALSMHTPAHKQAVRDFLKR